MKIGSLFSGYGGLDLAVQSAIGGTLAWVSDIEPGPSRILAHHHPDVPNLGDITAVDWTQVEPVDMICGGSPCQDLSTAGRRAGMRDGTRSGLWASMCEAIETIRPAFVVWENVLGALSAPASSDMGPCEFGMGCEGSVPLRALGRVLGDLTEIGYDAAWTSVRASDIGAPHRRERVFVLAWPADATRDAGRVNDRNHGTSADPRDDGLGVELPGGSGAKVAWPAGPATYSLLRTPNARDGDSRGTQPPAKRLAGGHQPSLADQVEHLLPTPAVNDMGAGRTVEEWDDWTGAMRARHGNGNGHGKSLSIEAQRLLPTPRATDGTKGGPNQRGSSGDLMLPSAVTKLLPTPRTENNENRQSEGYGKDGNFHGLVTGTSSWGDYAPAIARWEAVLGRPAPAPTEADFEWWERRKAARLNSTLPVGMRGSIRFIVNGPQHRLSPAFVEWMMGLPDGHVTDPAIWAGMTTIAARNAQLRALGNGVVPLQCEAALRHLLALIDQEESA